MTSDVLTVQGLNVSVGDTTLVADVDLTVGPGERVGLIGESGSGKSLTALSILGLLPDDVVPSGSVRLTGIEHDLIGADERALSRIRGRDLAMVFQEPMTALNPTMRIGDQIAESMLIHHTQPTRNAARAAAADLLDRVQLPADLLRAYPHQLSGGQRQRIVLAFALANDPALLICDEPTTALDVTVQALVLDLIVQGVLARSSALLFITHDLAVVATVCERVLVMYGGRVVESGPVHEIFTNPRHRYTQGLLAASNLEAAAPVTAPRAGTASRPRLTTIPGTVPAAGHFPSGCVFRNRCPHATDLCATTPDWSGTPTTGYACHHPAGASHA